MCHMSYSRRCVFVRFFIFHVRDTGDFCALFREENRYPFLFGSLYHVNMYLLKQSYEHLCVPILSIVCTDFGCSVITVDFSVDDVKEPFDSCLK